MVRVDLERSTVRVKAQDHKKLDSNFESPVCHLNYHIIALAMWEVSTSNFNIEVEMNSFQFDYVFDWTILKYQQTEIDNPPRRAIRAAGGTSAEATATGAASNRQSGAQDGKDNVWNNSTGDGTRRRISGAIVNAGSLSKHKSPAAPESGTEKNMAGVGFTDSQCMHFSAAGQGSSTSRRAVVSNSRHALVAEADISQHPATDMSPIALRKAGAQQSSSINSGDPKQFVPNRNHLISRNYEAAIRGIESLSFDMDRRL
eukprot:Gb_14498 [translate_table: standard]